MAVSMCVTLQSAQEISAYACWGPTQIFGLYQHSCQLFICQPYTKTQLSILCQQKLVINPTVHPVFELNQMRRNLYNLVTHHEERKFGDIFHRSMFSVMLLRCLKRHGYFGPDRTDVTPAGDSLSDDEAGGQRFSVLREKIF